MAISQTKADKKSVGSISKDSSGLSIFSLGGIDFATGTGAPTVGAGGEMKDSPKGSMYLDTAQPDLYCKTSAAGANLTWERVSAQS